MRMIGIMTSRYPRWCPHTSTSWSTTIGCGSRGGRPPETPPPPPRAMDRLYAWWAWWAAWSSGGGCTRTWRGPRSCPRSPTCTCSSSASSPCGRTPPTFMEANGWSDCAKRRRGGRGRTCVWPCWASSSWWAPSSAGSCCLCASRTTTWRCGTGRRRTRRRRRACGTRSAASCSCPPTRPSSTRRTASACAPPRRPRPARPPPRAPRPRPRPTTTPPSTRRTRRRPLSKLTTYINIALSSRALSLAHNIF